MKRNLLFFAAALLLAVGCNKEPDPTVEFAKAQYVLPADGSVTVEVIASKAPTSDLVLPLAFAGEATLGEEYTIDSENVTIKAGETTGSITLTANNNLDPEKSVVLTLKEISGGYTPGTNITAVVAIDAKEQLIYSFGAAQADVLDNYTIVLNLTGLISGKNFVASNDLEIPVAIDYGDNASTVCNFESDKIIIEKGNNYGTLKVKAGEVEVSKDCIVKVSVSSEASERFVEGDVATITLNIKGVLSISSILGDWKFSQIYDIDEVNEFFSEMEDDPDALPTHNEGFVLTFSENDGVFSVTPSGTGDFKNFFRESTLTYCAPMNITKGGDNKKTGPYTSSESNMFIAMVGDAVQQLTYFRLSKANRAFSAESETIGESTIAMRINSEGNLEIQLRDYDTPPFGEMWWDDSSFDPDMFGFASEFVR